MKKVDKPVNNNNKIIAGIGVLGIAGIAIFVVIILILLLFLFPITIGCMDKSHAYTNIHDVNIFEQNGNVILNVNYEKGYTIDGFSCAYPSGNPRENLIIDGLPKNDFISSINCGEGELGSIIQDNSIKTSLLCEAKISLGSNASSSIRGRHSVKVCADTSFSNRILKQSDSDPNAYHGLTWSSYDEETCSDEVFVNYNP